MPIDHLGFDVADFAKSRAFYAAALATGRADNGAPGPHALMEGRR